MIGFRIRENEPRIGSIPPTARCIRQGRLTQNAIQNRHKIDFEELPETQYEIHTKFTRNQHVPQHGIDRDSTEKSRVVLRNYRSSRAVIDRDSEDGLQQ